MSLLIIGSTSKITQNIIQQINKTSLYQHITIADLLPIYQFHQRYYRLRKSLAQSNSSLTVSLSKILSTQQLKAQIDDHQNILFVTHDYFQNVTSKTKLMQLTANLSKKKENVVFATPLQYDHFGYENPYANYWDSQNKVKQINPNASFIRSDIQDNAETISYFFKSKTFIEDLYFKVPITFRPAYISGETYAQTVVDVLKNKQKAANINLVGEDFVDYKQLKVTSESFQVQTDHFHPNIYKLFKNYRGLLKGSTSTA